MKKRMMSMGLTAFLGFVIFALIMMLQSKVFLGSYFMNESNQQKIYEQMMEKMEIEQSRYIGCYKLNETVYTAEITINTERFLVWYDENLNLLQKKNSSSFDEGKVHQKAASIGMNEVTVALAWYRNQPVISIENEEKEVLLNYETLEEVLIYKKRAVE